MIPVLTREAVEPLLDWMTLSDALLEGHRRPPAQVEDVLLSRADDRLLSRSAWIDGMGVGVKSVTVFPGNPAQGRPSVQGAMLVFDDATGALRAVVDNPLVTRWKTAGDSLLGARLLARPDALRYLIVGAGSVADSLIEAFRAWKPDLRIALWARRPEAAEAVADRHPGVTPVTDLAEAVSGADIVSTCTMARAPVIAGDWLSPGTHLDLIGAFTPDMREADDRALQRGKLYVDSRATTIRHIGELMIPLASGAITEADVLGDLGDLAAHGVPPRARDDITIYKNGGGAHLDLMTARVMLDAWEARQ
ncbi:ornithine cyclodeaminase family protein [Pararhodobacter marinus]|uniref:ornithine cyclodeaminase family protein n=1 Tax=Pararhodobacter marinus TaxID=2184063 RepID=UPI0035157841